jgi:hypothetical protein
MARSIETQNVVLKSNLDWERRLRNIERQWLKRHHPEIFKAMEANTQAANDKYHKRAFKKFSRACEDLFQPISGRSFKK